MVDVEEQRPDFDIGINDEEPRDVWRSESEGPKARHWSDSDDAQSGTAVAQERTEGFAGQKLRKLLDIQDSRSDGSGTVRRRSSKRRRRSRSRSRSKSGIPRVVQTSDRPSYVCPTKISEIFNEEISPKKLCILSAMKHGTTSAVHEIMPDASVAQICQMCKL